EISAVCGSTPYYRKLIAARFRLAVDAVRRTSGGVGVDGGLERCATGKKAPVARRRCVSLTG
ncbi:hypothetical protein, partial [Xanthomonas phaseoli]|uniref:hypothetical protein n=1 Tax=Xanthomonas phaseoli TaxID=1985254 RepID=UPI001EE65C60